MAYDAYMRFLEPRIDGEAKLQDTYKPAPSGMVDNDKWISLSEYSFSATMAVTQSRSGGTGAATTGKGKFEPFTFKKNVDTTSMTLAFHASAGTIFKTLVVNVFNSLGDAGGTKHEPFLFLTIVMKGAVISGCKFNGGGGDELPTEEITITYGSISYKYDGFQVDPDSGEIKKGRHSEFNWNTITNSGSKS